MSELALRVAGIGLRIVSDDRDIVRGLTDEYRPFIAETADTVTVCLSVERGWSASSDHGVHSGSARLRFARGHYEGLGITLGESGGGWTMRIGHDRKLFDLGLRAILSRELPRIGGLLLHAAGVADGRRAYVFPGESGAGKSTIAYLSSLEGREVLGDELVAVRVAGERCEAYGTPFRGEHKGPVSPGGVELRALVRPAKGEKLELTADSDSGAVSGVLRNTLNFRHSYRANAEMLAAADSIVRRVEKRVLEFRREDRIWEVLAA